MADGIRSARFDPDAPTPTPSLLARQAAEAARRAPEDPELVALRRLLADLRPDCADPLLPPPPPTAPAPTMMRVSTAPPWDRTPSSLGGNLGAALEALSAGPRTAADVLARVDGLPREAAVVLRWLRSNADLSAEGAGLRGVYVDVGVHFAAWAGEATAALWARDLGARRAGAYAHGRKLVLTAERAWG